MDVCQAERRVGEPLGLLGRRDGHQGEGVPSHSSKSDVAEGENPRIADVDLQAQHQDGVDQGEGDQPFLATESTLIDQTGAHEETEQDQAGGHRDEHVASKVGEHQAALTPGRP